MWLEFRMRLNKVVPSTSSQGKLLKNENLKIMKTKIEASEGSLTFVRHVRLGSHFFTPKSHQILGVKKAKMLFLHPFWTCFWM